MQTSLSRAAVLAAALSMALLLSGCGVKPSQLEPPPGTDPADVRDPTVKKAPPEDGAKPDRPFVLDGLLM